MFFNAEVIRLPNHQLLSSSELVVEYSYRSQNVKGKVAPIELEQIIIDYLISKCVTR